MLNVSTNVRLYDRELTDGEHQWSRNQSMVNLHKIYRWKQNKMLIHPLLNKGEQLVYKLAMVRILLKVI
jgi:hypothetical protein